MPAVYRYKVTQEREVTVTAVSPADAVSKAAEFFNNTPAGAFVDIVETSITAHKEY